MLNKIWASPLPWKYSPLCGHVSGSHRSASWVSGEGCFDIESGRLGGEGGIVISGLFNVVLRVDGHSQIERGTFEQRGVQIVMLLYYDLITVSWIPTTSGRFVKAELLPELGLSALSYLCWERQWLGELNEVLKNSPEKQWVLVYYVIVKRWKLWKINFFYWLELKEATF